MFKLNNPKVSFKDSIDYCDQGIGGRNVDTQALKQRLSDSKQYLLGVQADYLSCGNTNELHTLPTCARIGNPVVIGCLSKGDLEKLYNSYLVPKGKPARAAVYDEIMNAAKDECPFCGGIGVPNNLDHFLPKTHFPQYALLPLNLVPSCEKCNMGEKGQAYASSADEQFIHPYLDNVIFFENQWVFAKFHVDVNAGGGVFEYDTVFNDDNGWNKEQTSRAAKHFKDFNLSNRYSIQAARELRGAWAQTKANLQRGVNKEDIILNIFEPKILSAPHKNHWEVAMYQALSCWLLQVDDVTLRQLELL